MEGTQATASRRGPTDSHHLLCWCRYPWKHSLPPEGQPRCRPSRSSRDPDTLTIDHNATQTTTLSSWHTTTGRPLTSMLPPQPTVLVWQSLCTPRCPSSITPYTPHASVYAHRDSRLGGRSASCFCMHRTQPPVLLPLPFLLTSALGARHHRSKTRCCPSPSARHHAHTSCAPRRTRFICMRRQAILPRTVSCAAASFGRYLPDQLW